MLTQCAGTKARMHPAGPILNGMTNMHYWIGLIIVSIAVGHRYDQIDGWLFLGGGMMFFGFLTGLYDTINVYLNKFAKK